MKSFNLYNMLGLASVAMMSLTSCDDDVHYHIYQDPTNVKFEVVTPELSFKGNATQPQVITIKSPKVPSFGFEGNFRTASMSEFSPKYEFLYTVLPQATLSSADQYVTIQVGDQVQKVTVKVTPADPGFLGLGVNLGNHFDTSNMTWGYWDQATPTASFYNNLAAAGINSVRIPTTWTCHMDANQVIDPAYLNEVAENVDNALNAGLKVVLNTHHDSFETELGKALASSDDSLQIANLITTLWTQVATHFADRSQNLMFETFNEVHDGDDWGTGSDALFAMLNSWNQIAVNAIRATGGNNATRTIGISGYAANADMAINSLKLPNDPANKLAVSVHCYDPYDFCIPATRNNWGSDEDYKALDDYMFKLADNFLNKGIQVYIGEFGCAKRVSAADEPARLTYLTAVTNAARTYGISCLVWDNFVNDGGNESHSYFNHNDGTIVDATAQAAVKAIVDGYNTK